MANADSERKNKAGLRDVFLVLVGVFASISFQSLFQGLKTVANMPPLEYAIVNFTLSAAFLILAFALMAYIAKASN